MEIPSKPVSTQPPNNQSRPFRHGGSSKIVKHHIPDSPAAGQMAFRMLCRWSTAGGVIGSSGSIIKYLESLTGSKIQFEEGRPNCLERVINIVGDAVAEKKIRIAVGDSTDEDFIVSKAQEGLLRVFERVLEVEGGVENNGNDSEGKNRHDRDGFISCRLLVPLGRVGAVMGKGGKVVISISKNSGAMIRVLKKDQIPACAGSEEELIQIIGGAVAVKKALLAVTRCLQDRILEQGALGQVSPHGSSQNFDLDFISSNKPNLPSFSGGAVSDHSYGQSFSEDFKRTLKVEDKSSLRKVVFKYLCPNSIVGGVIGKGAIIVKSLEKESGASIKFESPVTGSNERLAIISSLENLNALYSPAQIAIIRVFSRCMEISLDQGLLLSLDNGQKVTASIAVPSTQVDCLLNEGRGVASEISKASGVEIKVKEDDIRNYVAENNHVVQIIGEYDNVKSALFQVTGKLRENLFSGKGFRRVNLKHSSSLAMYSDRPNGREQASQSSLLSPSSRPHIHQLDPNVSMPNNAHSTGLKGEQIKKNRRGSSQWPVDNTGGSSNLPSVFEHGRKVATRIPEQSVEVLIPVKEFGHVYGENCSNVARLREISGAAVHMQDPSPGDSFAKVIISGLPEQIEFAQSLLQAFILT